VFTTVERHRRMPYLKNLVGQVAPQALPDLRENSLYETLSFFYDQTGRSRPGGAHMKLNGYQCHFHEVGGHSPPYGALKTTWKNVGWAAPTQLSLGKW